MTRNRTKSNSGSTSKNFRRRTSRAIAASLLGSALFGLVAGCATPIFSTDNRYLVYLPGAAWRSDQIPGVLRPWERVKLIEEKGKKGENAPAEEKDVLLLQLAQEYATSTSPNIRRAALEAISRISKNHRNPVAEKTYREALEDSDLNLALSACDAWGVYCVEGDVAKANAEERRLAVELLSDKYRRLPYSIAAGSEEENKRRKDLRVAILRNLGSFKPEESPLVLETLELGLTGEKLDDGALQDCAMRSLEKATGKKYGLDADAWLRYLAFERGEESVPPPEPSLTARLPKIETGIFK